MSLQEKTVKRVFATLVCILVLNTAARAEAQECFRSTECPGATICVNRACTTPDMVLEDCLNSDDCDWSTCVHGYCKPSGVRCESTLGTCEMDSNLSSCECASGDSFGMASSSPVELIPDPELYAMCIETLTSECEPPPDPAEDCTEEELNTCMSLIPKMESINDNCFDDWDTEGAVDTEMVDMPGDADTDETIAEHADGPVISALDPPSPYDLVDCCEELRWAAEAPETQAYIDCLLDLATDDCEGVLACEEIFEEGGDIDIDIDTDNGEADTAGEEPRDADSEEEGDTGESADNSDEDTGDVEGDGEDAAGEDTGEGSDDPGETTTPKSKGNGATEDSGGCSVVIPAGSGALIPILEALF